jgi:peptidoglycan/xylan/chitin deacetylase (PgdA/CDA1 family)
MLDFLMEHFQLLSADQILAALEGHCSLPPHSLLLTFDDGYRDFITMALPVLQSRQVPAVIFPTTAGLVEPKRLLWIDKVALAVDTGLVDGWLPACVVVEQEPEVQKSRIVSHLLTAPLEVLKRVEEELDRRLPILASEIASRLYMTAQDLRMVGPGIAIGSHSVSHRVLSRLSRAEVIEELVQSKAVIEAAAGRVVNIFAYPIGRAGDVPSDADSLLPACGYAMGFTMEAGRNVVRPGVPRFRFKRVSAGRSISDLQCNLLRASLSKP